MFKLFDLPTGQLEGIAGYRRWFTQLLADFLIEPLHVAADQKYVNAVDLGPTDVPKVRPFDSN